MTKYFLKNFFLAYKLFTDLYDKIIGVSWYMVLIYVMYVNTQFMSDLSLGFKANAL